MNKKNSISSASFIKNVQPSFKRVAVFVQKHILNIALLVGLISRGIEIEHFGVLLPVYYYTDFFKDFRELLQSLLCTNENPFSADRPSALFYNKPSFTFKI